MDTARDQWTTDTTQPDSDAADWLSATDAAPLLGVSQRTVRRAIASGDLPATKRSGVFQIALADLEAYRVQRDRGELLSHSPASIVDSLTDWEPEPAQALPSPLTALIGRSREETALFDLFDRDGVRLLTLTGPGGVGKTRLAIEIANAYAKTAPDSVYFVPLAAVTDASLVPASISAALGLLGRSSLPLLVDALAERDVTLVIDNFEHVLEATPFLTALLEQCPRLRILVTSRVLLRVAGEHALMIRPLEIPDPDPESSIDELASSNAVQLFAERARAVLPEFTLTETSTPLVADICRRLDGLPLAIELAAARLTHLSLSALRDRLERRLPLLRGGGVAQPERHRNLRDTIAWSHDLLDDSEQILFRRLAAFSGAFELDAVEAIAQRLSPAEPSVLDALAGLVNASLVQHDPAAIDAPRYQLLETIREFAAERLAASGEEPEVRRAHAAYFLEFVERRAPAPFLPYDLDHFRQLTTDWENLRAALLWLGAHGPALDHARFAISLGWYTILRGHAHDGQLWLEQGLDTFDDLPDSVQVTFALTFGLVLCVRGDFDSARQWLTTGFDAALALDDALHATQAYIGLGLVANAELAYDQSPIHFERAFALANSMSDSRIGSSLAATALANHGIAAQGQQRFDEAYAYYSQALATHRENGYLRGVAQSLLDLSAVACDQRDITAAITHLREGLLVAWKLGETRVVIEGLGHCAKIAVLAGQPEVGVRLFGANDRLRTLTGISHGRARHEYVFAIACEALGTSLYDEVWNGGRTLSLKAAVAEALEFAPEPPAAPGPRLTRRESEILNLLAAGKHDHEIADSLFISVRTVEHHVARLNAKLGVRSRSAAVSTAFTVGLLPDTRSS
jgi:non-specific serine/threonine protein kinase